MGKVLRLIISRNRKGFLQIDFAIALLIFFIFSFFLYSYYFSYVNAGIDSFKQSNLNFLAGDLCLFLVSNPGVPVNWEDNVLSFKTLGFKSYSGGYVDSDKVLAMSSLEYFDVLDGLGLNVFFGLNVSKVGTSSSWSFGDFSGAESYVANCVCYGVLEDGSLYRFYVEVWE